MKYSRIVLIVILAESFVSAADWPQILGPTRNGKSNEQLNVTWPTDGPKTVWSYPLGQGFAGVAVAGKQVVAFHRQGDKERVEAIDRTTGKQIWKNDSDAYYRGGFNPDSGPRCVPIVSNKVVFTYGAAGIAQAIDRANGKTIWTRDLHKDYRAQDGYFGAGSSPIVVDDLLLINVGGRNKASIVAVETSNGKTRWNIVSDDASYSSPVSYRHENKLRVAFITRLKMLSIAPATGDIDFTIPFGARGPTVNAAMPVFTDGNLFLTASYGIGAKLISLDKQRLAAEIWANDNTLSSQYNTPIFHEGFLYGIHGREDVGSADLRCVEAETGKVRWSKSRFGVAHLLLIGDKLLALTIDGDVVVFSPNADRYVEIARAEITSDTTRALPAFSNGQLFVRDSRRLYCVQLSPHE